MCHFGPHRGPPFSQHVAGRWWQKRRGERGGSDHDPHYTQRCIMFSAKLSPRHQLPRVKCYRFSANGPIFGYRRSLLAGIVRRQCSAIPLAVAARAWMSGPQHPTHPPRGTAISLHHHHHRRETPSPPTYRDPSHIARNMACAPSASIESAVAVFEAAYAKERHSVGGVMSTIDQGLRVLIDRSLTTVHGGGDDLIITVDPVTRRVAASTKLHVKFNRHLLKKHHFEATAQPTVTLYADASRDVGVNVPMSAFISMADGSCVLGAEGETEVRSNVDPSAGDEMVDDERADFNKHYLDPRYTLPADVAQFIVDTSVNDIASLEFSLPSVTALRTVSITVFIVSNTATIAISDIDGTITAADLLGLHAVMKLADSLDEGSGVVKRAVHGLHRMASGVKRFVKRVAHRHDDHPTTDLAVMPGVVDLYNHAAEQGWQFIYLTSRPAMWSSMTRAHLDAAGLPLGPIFSNFEGERSAAAIELRKEADRFKTACLCHSIRPLFQPGFFEEGNGGRVVAFGNRLTDLNAYRSVGISAAHIAIVQGGRSVDYPQHPVALDGHVCLGLPDPSGCSCGYEDPTLRSWMERALARGFSGGSSC